LERPGPGPPRREPGGDDDDDDDGASRKVKLVMSGDAHKDQTYFLAALSQAQLAGLSFPIGGLPKAEIRDIARAAGLPNANRKDSQGICFLGKVKFSEFVAEHLGEKPGKIVEIETGLEIGKHRGFWFHTIGQRSGLGLSGGPWYVCGKDAKRNIVFITKDYYAGDKERRAFRVGEFNWISGEAPAKSARGYALGFGDDADADDDGGDDADDADDADDGGATEAHVAAASTSELYCKVRHGERRYRCTLKFDADGEGGKVVLDANDQGLAAGQFAVFYDGRECLGSGVIAERVAPIDVKVLVDPKSAAKRRSSDNSAR
jgi:tRNA-specific 2-thiouridylase